MSSIKQEADAPSQRQPANIIELPQVKPAKSKTELEALILAQARELGLYDVVRSVAVRRLHDSVAGANWIVAIANEVDERSERRRDALRQIVPPLREMFDLRED